MHLELCLKGGYIFTSHLRFTEAGWEWSSVHLSTLPAPHWATYRNHVPFLVLRFLNYEMKAQTRCSACVIKIYSSATLGSDSSTDHAYWTNNSFINDEEIISIIYEFQMGLEKLLTSGSQNPAKH